MLLWRVKRIWRKRTVCSSAGHIDVVLIRGDCVYGFCKKSHFGKMKFWPVEHFLNTFFNIFIIKIRFSLSNVLIRGESNFDDKYVKRSVQLVRGSSFWNDLSQNPYFNNSLNNLQQTSGFQSDGIVKKTIKKRVLIFLHKKTIMGFHFWKIMSYKAKPSRKIGTAKRHLLTIQGILALCEFHYCEFHYCGFSKLLLKFG